MAESTAAIGHLGGDRRHGAKTSCHMCYLDLIGPLYEAVGDPAVVGLRIDEPHTNARGFLHAKVLVAVADVVMGHTAPGCPTRAW